jgi:hypothetical protein
MTRIRRRVRALLGVPARRVILAVMLAGVTYLAEMIAGLHPQAGSVVTQAAGYWLAYGVTGAILATRRRRAAGAAAAAGAAGGSREPVRRELPTPEPEVVILVGQGRKIQAIKRYREQNPGTGLKEAKDVIDGLVDQTQLTSLAGRNRTRR